MKTILLTLLISFVTCTCYSQHYYNEILMTREIMKKRELYQQNKVKAVSFISLDANNEPIDGFSSELKISGNYTQINTTTATTLTGNTQNSSIFNSAGQLVRTIDTAEGNKTTITYTWNTNNQLTALTSISVSPGAFQNKEQHHWVYADGKPVSMIKIKNDSDTTYITFVTDEQGNIGEEKSVRKGQQQPTWYYYYNTAGQLTDIVRYNARAKRLLPDYIFEYNEQGRLSTMLVTTEGTNDYQKWYYTYNEQGLKTRDDCFSKTRVLIGRINYEYRY